MIITNFSCAFSFTEISLMLKKSTASYLKTLFIKKRLSKHYLLLSSYVEIKMNLKLTGYWIKSNDKYTVSGKSKSLWHIVNCTMCPGK